MQYAQELEYNSAHLVEHIESQLVAILIKRQTHAAFDEQQAKIDRIWNDVVIWIESKTFSHIRCRRNMLQSLIATIHSWFLENSVRK